MQHVMIGMVLKEEQQTVVQVSIGKRLVHVFMISCIHVGKCFYYLGAQCTEGLVRDTVLCEMRIFKLGVCIGHLEFE